ncbi:MAG: DUF927 domain-containing protein [Sarcina sp.]
MEFKKDSKTNELFSKNDKNQWEKVMHGEIDILNIQQNTDDQTVKAVIEYTDRLNERKEMEVDREIFTQPMKLLGLARYGIDINLKNMSKISEYLSQREWLVDTKRIHENIGFSGNTFKLDSCIGVDSIYTGNLLIKSKGERDLWWEMFENEVLGNANLEFIIGTALSASIIGYIGEEESLDTLIVHLSGNSTTGKSTALKLAISLFGYPDIKENGLFSTYNSTQNALINKLGGIKGVPIAFDELSMVGGSNYTKLIYTLAGGTDKSRLSKEIVQREIGRWSTTILSNGEKSLLGNANKNAGLKVRVVEIDNITWTKDAKNANAILATIGSNYGWIGFEFVEKLMQLGREEIRKRYKKSCSNLKRILKANFVVDSMTDRRVAKLGTIFLALDMFEEVFECKLNRGGIEKLMVEIEEKSSRERNFGRSFIDFLKGYYETNLNTFKRDDNPIDKYIGRARRRKDKKGEKYTELTFSKIKFDEVVKAGGFEDTKVVAKELKLNNLLVCENDRLTIRRKGESGGRVKFYVVKLYDEN